MIMRRRAKENSNFIVNQKLGEQQFTISDLKDKLQNGDNSIGKKFCILEHLLGALLSTGHKEA